MSYLQCLCCSVRTSYYVCTYICMVHEYLVRESICAGAQKHDKCSCTQNRTAACCHNSVRRARDHRNLHLISRGFRGTIQQQVLVQHSTIEQVDTGKCHQEATNLLRLHREIYMYNYILYIRIYTHECSHYAQTAQYVE